MNFIKIQPVQLNGLTPVIQLPPIFLDARNIQAIEYCRVKMRNEHGYNYETVNGVSVLSTNFGCREMLVQGSPEDILFEIAKLGRAYNISVKSDGSTISEYRIAGLTFFCQKGERVQTA